ncbi:hypothetical protein Ddye_009341 [Dipteronia dyeriana]|uniref:Uncharacterized protein n=1 Tax=Dipteronia dyeriana TaxID=168575 RepID=A0AAE0CM99_9ROSI|nr:hypothetical protein Ddye_009341 [Dipteronia dyeriana]
MSSSDESRGGYKLIWLISCFLFVSIAAGGGFLTMYMILPESPSTSWLPLAGVTLVCLPWLFWFLTFFYRVVSRACGFRMVIPGGGGGGGGKGDTNVGGGGDHGVTSDDDDDDHKATNTGGGQGMVANNAAAAATTTPSVVVLREQNDDDDNDNNRSHQRKESSSNDESIASRESEIPLAYSMN